MTKVVMYTTAVCPYCVNAKKLLAEKGVVPEEIRIDTQPQLRQEMMQKKRAAHCAADLDWRDPRGRFYRPLGIRQGRQAGQSAAGLS